MLCGDLFRPVDVFRRGREQLVCLTERTVVAVLRVENEHDQLTGEFLYPHIRPKKFSPDSFNPFLMRFMEEIR